MSSANRLRFLIRLISEHSSLYLFLPLQPFISPLLFTLYLLKSLQVLIEHEVLGAQKQYKDQNNGYLSNGLMAVLKYWGDPDLMFN
jgi:hypothetical protein